MDNYKFKKWILIMLLPIVFASVGYFGMKMFLSGKRPEVAMPKKEETTSEVPAVETETEKSTVENKNASKSAVLPEISTDADLKETAIEDSSESVAAPAETLPEEIDTEKPQTQTSEYRFDSINIFSLQVGSYSTLSNAEKHVETLNAEDIRSFVYSGNGYKVLVGVSTSRENVASLKEKYADKIPDSFVKSITIVPEDVIYSDDHKKDEFKKIASLYRKRLVNNLSFISNIDTYSNAELESILKQDMDSLNELIEKLNDSKKTFESEENISRIVEKMVLYSENAKTQIGQSINKGSESSAVFEVYLKEILQFNKLNE